jgi:hypothetical protein
MKRANQLQMSLDCIDSIHELYALQNNQLQNWLAAFYEQTEPLPEDFLRNRLGLSTETMPSLCPKTIKPAKACP